MSVACVHSQRKHTYILRITRSCFLELQGGRRQRGRGMGTWRRGGGCGRGKRWGLGDRGLRVEDREGVNTSWLMLFYDTWSQLIYSVLYYAKLWVLIGLFKMFSRWILHIFIAQIQSE